MATAGFACATIKASTVCDGSGSCHIMGVDGQCLQLQAGYALLPSARGAQESCAETVEEAQGCCSKEGEASRVSAARVVDLDDCSLLSVSWWLLISRA